MVTLGFLSHPEAQRFRLFLSHLVVWVRTELPSLLSRADESGDGAERGESGHAVESVVQRQFALSLRHQVLESVRCALPLARAAQGEAVDPLAARDAKKVPRIFLLLARRMGELEGFKQEGAFRVSAAQEKRERYLRRIGMVRGRSGRGT